MAKYVVTLDVTRRIDVCVQGNDLSSAKSEAMWSFGDAREAKLETIVDLESGDIFHESTCPMCGDDFFCKHEDGLLCSNCLGTEEACK